MKLVLTWLRKYIPSSSRLHSHLIFVFETDLFTSCSPKTSVYRNKRAYAEQKADSCCGLCTQIKADEKRPLPSRVSMVSLKMKSLFYKILHKAFLKGDFEKIKQRKQKKRYFPQTSLCGGKKFLSLTKTNDNVPQNWTKDQQLTTRK